MDINGLNIAGIGITNQRETTIVWDTETEEPVYNAIVWQDRRTSDYCDELKKEGLTEMIRQKTGLIIDAYFSATKIKWILDNVPGARVRAEKGKLMFGTVDTWLIWRLTRGEVHVTDVTNASRTMLFNINTLEWDKELLDLFGIPESMMPEVKSSSEIYGHTKTTIFAHKVPIAGIAGDQQAALFGQMCIEPGMVKNTYGTGCFLLMNSGDKPVLSKNNLITTIAWKIGEKTTYALEGIAFQTMDIMNAMSLDTGIPLKELKVDGGASRNNLLLQFQADILRTRVIRPEVVETTALGAAYLAGLATDYWAGIEDIKKQWKVDRTFDPSGDEKSISEAIRGWNDAVKRTLSNYTTNI